MSDDHEDDYGIFGGTADRFDMRDGILPIWKIANLLEDLRLTAVARATGISYPTMQKLADGNDTCNYQLSTLRTISSYLTERNRRRDQTVRKPNLPVKR